MLKTRNSLLPCPTKSALAAVVLWCVFFAAGCKTSEDAAAAATQMSTTAKCLSAYYKSVSELLEKTDQLNTLESEFYSVPYPEDNRKLLLQAETEVAGRVELAEDFSKLANDFAKLTGSTAPDDVAASALQLQTEVDTLASITASSLEQRVLKDSLTLLVKAVQEHKEREAATAIDGFAKGLTDLFVREAPIWKSTEEVYSRTAARVASELVDHNSVDATAMIPTALAPALDPFDLQPAGASADINAKLPILAKHQIAVKRAALDGAYLNATHAMMESLEEMSRRIHTVTQDKPMRSRADPLTLATVQDWVTQLSAL